MPNRWSQPASRERRGDRDQAVSAPAHTPRTAAPPARQARTEPAICRSAGAELGAPYSVISLLPRRRSTSQSVLTAEERPVAGRSARPVDLCTRRAGPSRPEPGDPLREVAGGLIGPAAPSSSRPTPPGTHSRHCIGSATDPAARMNSACVARSPRGHPAAPPRGHRSRHRLRTRRTGPQRSRRQCTTGTGRRRARRARRPAPLSTNPRRRPHERHSPSDATTDPVDGIGVISEHREPFWHQPSTFGGHAGDQWRSVRAAIVERRRSRTMCSTWARPRYRPSSATATYRSVLRSATSIWRSG